MCVHTITRAVLRLSGSRQTLGFGRVCPKCVFFAVQFNHRLPCSISRLALYLVVELLRGLGVSPSAPTAQRQDIDVSRYLSRPGSPQVMEATDGPLHLVEFALPECGDTTPCAALHGLDASAVSAVGVRAQSGSATTRANWKHSSEWYSCAASRTAGRDVPIRRSQTF